MDTVVCGGIVRREGNGKRLFLVWLGMPCEAHCEGLPFLLVCQLNIVRVGRVREVDGANGVRTTRATFNLSLAAKIERLAIGRKGCSQASGLDALDLETAAHRE